MCTDRKCICPVHQASKYPVQLQRQQLRGDWLPLRSRPRGVRRDCQHTGRHRFHPVAAVSPWVRFWSLLLFFSSQPRAVNRIYKRSVQIKAGEINQPFRSYKTSLKTTFCKDPEDGFRVGFVQQKFPNIPKWDPPARTRLANGWRPFFDRL